ncbi:MAG TPA: tetratricopeptide repeat protein, partial [Terriglobales bacterium]|nr:tetratricopeptide repeat protein [Terriglobales bacterium]
MQAAERNVLQGKIANAIAEYEKVIAHDPRDLTVQNTLGDLYVRSGRTEDALTCFRKVADAYAADGFAMKAIAMYKKINKLSPHAVECILKLGELYSLQGLFSDARAQYVAAAEHQLSRGDSEAAAGVYRKALELDPENAHMQQRLAELYLSSGKQDQAAEIYIMAAQSLHLRGRHAAALDILEKLLKVAPKHPAALMLCGKVAAESGNHARAVRALEQIPDINERPEALRQLVRVRLASAEVNVAEQDAGKLLASHNDASGVFAVADHLTQNSEAERGLRLLHELSDELIAANTADITRLLQAATADGKSSIPVLEAALQLHRRIADRGSIGEVIELLAQVCVENGHHSRARELYTELVELEPDNEMHQRNLAQLQARAGEPKAAEGAAAEAVDAVAPAPPPNANTGYTSETAQAVEAALTDAELFQSYNSPARAIAALEAVLPQAPRDAGLNHRLATLYVRAERYLDAANCFAVLKKAHEAEGRSEEAEQCAAMEEKYRQRGGAADTRPAANTPSAAQPKPQPAPAGAVPEFDLAPSVPAEAAGFDQPAPAAAGAQPEPEAAAQPARRSEWDEMAVVDEEDPDAGSASTAAASESADPFAAALDEARFYLQHGLHAEAETALRQAEDLRPGAIEVAQLRAQF